MRHLSAEELIEAYYGESASSASAHLAACRDCAARYREVQQSLDAMRVRNLESIRPAQLSRQQAEYGDRIWEALRPRLLPYEQKKAGWRRWANWKALALAGCCAVLLVMTFVSGRFWERHLAKKTSVATNSNPQAMQPRVVVVLTDHLDRTERLLVALEHADSTDPIEDAQLQSQARELLASNRLYRTTARDAGDPVLASALDRLEGVLAEVAYDPNLTAKSLEQVRKEMNTEGILFEIRVLRAHRPNAPNVPNHSRGAAI